MKKSSNNVTKICLTGGPCAGKTTAQAAIKEDLTKQGIKVFMVPEAATLLWGGGANIGAEIMTDH